MCYSVNIQKLGGDHMDSDPRNVCKDLKNRVIPPRSIYSNQLLPIFHVSADVFSAKDLNNF